MKMSSVIFERSGNVIVVKDRGQSLLWIIGKHRTLAGDDNNFYHFRPKEQVYWFSAKMMAEIANKVSELNTR